MIKWIGVILTTIALAGGTYYGYTEFKLQMTKTKDAYSYTPLETSIIIEAKNVADLYEQVSTTNLLWDGFRNGNTDKDLAQFEPIMKLMQHVNVLALYNEQNSNWMFVFQKNEIQNNVALQQALTEFSKFTGVTSVNGGTFEWNKVLYYYTLDQGSFLVSPSNELIKEAILASNAKKHSSQFTQARKTSSKNVRLKIYLHQTAHNTFTQFFLNQNHAALALPTGWSEWIGLDVDLNPNEITLRGYAISSDSINQQVEIFRNQSATPHEITGLLPEKTAYFKRYGFDDFAILHAQLLAHSDKDTLLNNIIFRIDTTYGFDMSSAFFPFIDNEIVFAEINQPYNIEEVDKMIWAGVSDADLVLDRLATFSLATSQNAKQPYQVVTYKNKRIYPIYESQFLTASFGGDAFSSFPIYTTIINDHIVFAESPATLQNALDKIARNQTLSNNDNYALFSDKNNKSSNLFIFYNPSKYEGRLGHKLSKKGDALLRNEVLNQYQGYGIQMSYEKENMYFLSLYTSHNPVSKTASNTLWELALDTTCSFKPFIFTNHYSQAKEIFIQDDLNNLYLINNKGHVLWKKRIEGKITSAVGQIDILNNQKYQLVFNTQNALYIIDRNGNNVSGFPVYFKSQLSADVAVLDYNNTHTYRFIAGLENGNLINLNSKGQKVPGWEYANAGKAISHSIIYGKIKGRDYLLAVYKNGNMVALNRRGQVRLKFKSRFSENITGSIFAKFQSQLTNSYVVAQSAEGYLEQITLTDSKLTIGKYPANWHHFYDTDHDGSIELVHHNGQEIKAVSLDGHYTSKFTARDSLNNDLMLFNLGEYTLIGYQNNTRNKIYLSHTNGELLNDFPLLGASEFSLFDINRDGRFNVITTDKTGILKAYNVDL